MTKVRLGFLAALSLSLVAVATAFAGQARPVAAHSRTAFHGKYVRPAIVSQYGAGGCHGGQDSAAYDGSDL